MGPLSEARLFPDLSTCAFSAPRPSLRGYWFQERQKTSNFGAALPVPLGVPAPLRSRLSCSAEFTVEVCAIASSVSGLEPQNPTLRRDSFPKKIPWLPSAGDSGGAGQSLQLRGRSIMRAPRKERGVMDCAVKRQETSLGMSASSGI